jgi:hypothetical protein
MIVGVVLFVAWIAGIVITTSPVYVFNLYDAKEIVALSGLTLVLIVFLVMCRPRLINLWLLWFCAISFLAVVNLFAPHSWAQGEGWLAIGKWSLYAAGAITFGEIAARCNPDIWMRSLSWASLLSGLIAMAQVRVSCPFGYEPRRSMADMDCKAWRWKF